MFCVLLLLLLLLFFVCLFVCFLLSMKGSGYYNIQRVNEVNTILLCCIFVLLLVISVDRIYWEWGIE